MAGIFKEENRLIDTEEAAEGLGVRPSTIRKWVFEKRIPFVKFGPGRKARVMFNPKRLNRWIEEMSHEPETDGEAPVVHRRVKKPNPDVVKRFKNFVEDMEKGDEHPNL